MVTVDPYYLRDVITIEMNVAEIPPTPQELPALKAQAVAARTVASWKAANMGYVLGQEGGWGYINNCSFAFLWFMRNFRGESRHIWCFDTFPATIYGG